MLTKDFYTTILSQAISPCGQYLVTGDIYGKLSVFNIFKINQPDTVLWKEDLIPKNKIIVKPDYQINSLLTTPNYLLVGVVGEIYAFNWKTIKNVHLQPDWSIDLPSRRDSLENTDINDMKYNVEDNHIYVGCGDNNIYVFDLETRRHLKTLSGHTDYIHCLSNIDRDFLSGAEDGIVNIWDSRTYKITNKILPHLNVNVSRPELGKWIGAVSLNEDYILCGGGPHLSLWHFRFLTNSTVFPISDKGIHVAHIYKDKILAGGRSKLFYQMSFDGEIISEIPVSAVTIYSAVHQEQPSSILCLAGSSPKVDICSNFLYKNQQLSVY